MGLTDKDLYVQQDNPIYIHIFERMKYVMYVQRSIFVTFKKIPLPWKHSNVNIVTSSYKVYIDLVEKVNCHLTEERDK